MHTLAMHLAVAMTEQENHQAPTMPFAVPQAHSVMRYHVACRAIRCPRKAAALQTLTAAGLVVSSMTHAR